MRHRQPAQSIGLAAVALIGMVGMLAFVIDAGLLFMAHREAQKAADAAALAGIQDWPTDPACTGKCLTAVNDYAQRNLGILARLCADSPIAKPPTVGSLNNPPGVATLTVTVSCNASLTFGRILWDEDSHKAPIFAVSGTAVAAIGNQAPSGEIDTYTPAGPHLIRLIH